MTPLSEEEAAILLARLHEVDLPLGSLARVLNVNVTTVQRWLSGRNAMSPNFAAVLEAVLAFRSRQRGPGT